jgi:hypothetical protein
MIFLISRIKKNTVENTSFEGFCRQGPDEAKNDNFKNQFIQGKGGKMNESRKSTMYSFPFDKSAEGYLAIAQVMIKQFGAGIPEKYIINALKMRDRGFFVDEDMFAPLMELVEDHYIGKRSHYLFFLSYNEVRFSLHFAEQWKKEEANASTAGAARVSSSSDSSSSSVDVSVPLIKDQDKDTFVSKNKNDVGELTKSIAKVNIDDNDVAKQKKMKANKLASIRKQLVSGKLKENAYAYLKNGECNTKTTQQNILKAYATYRKMNDMSDTATGTEITFEDMLVEMETILSAKK